MSMICTGNLFSKRKRTMDMDETIVIKKDAVKLVRKRLKELLAPLGFQPHPKERNRLMRVREELIDEVSLRTDGTHLTPCFHIYYRKAPFTSLYVDLVNNSLWRVMKAREPITTNLWWNVKISQEGPYYYEMEHFEAVWRDVVLALERYILPYMDAMSVEKLLDFMVKPQRREDGEKEIFRVNQIVFFSDIYFACVDEAAVYGVGLWIAGRYAEGLPYIIFAQNKYREHIRPREFEKEQFREGRVLAVLDKLIATYECKPQELKETVERLTNQIAENWADYMM